MTTFIPLPAALQLDTASWKQTPLVVRQAMVQLLVVIQQQEARIAALEARLSQHSCNADRPRLFRSTVCDKALLLDHEGDSRSEAGTSWASPSVAGTYRGHRGDA